MNTTLAALLSRNTHRIAQLESAGECYREIFDLADSIERVINRPLPPKYCGACPTLDENQNRCAEPIYAKHDEVETQCWRCKQTFNVEALIQAGLSNARGLLYTASEILDTMAEMGQPISERTWRWWRANGKIEARNEWGSEPRFWLNDVVRLRNRETAA